MKMKMKYKCPKCGYETNSKAIISYHRWGICSFVEDDEK